MIEVLYLRGCPHADGLVDHIEQLVSQHRFDERVVARCIHSDAQARAEHFLGSPTVRVNGRDVDPKARDRHAYGLVCRTYPGAAGAPQDEWVLAALQGSDSPSPKAARPARSTWAMPSPRRSAGTCMITRR